LYENVYCDYWIEIGFASLEAIVAWMLLPEPYKEESE